MQRCALDDEAADPEICRTSGDPEWVIARRDSCGLDDQLLAWVVAERDWSVRRSGASHHEALSVRPRADECDLAGHEAVERLLDSRPRLRERAGVGIRALRR